MVEFFQANLTAMICFYITSVTNWPSYLSDPFNLRQIYE